jgi:dihydropyrimidinase
MSEGVLAGRITLQQFVALTSTNAARLYGLYPRKGTIAIGSDADLVIWDTGTKRPITNAMLHHAVDYTPYEGIEVSAWPAATLSRGRVVWDGRDFLGAPGDGEFLRCGLPEPARPRTRSTSWRQWVGY